MSLPSKNKSVTVTSCGVGLFMSDSGYLINPDSNYCTCKGWFYRKNCKHLNLFKSNNYKLLGGTD